MAAVAVAQPELPDGFHVRGKVPKQKLDAQNRVIAISLPVFGPFDGKADYEDDIHSLFGPIMKSKNDKSEDVVQRVCSLCCEVVNTTTNNQTMRNHFVRKGTSHMLSVPFRAWPPLLREEVTGRWGSAVQKMEVVEVVSAGKKRSQAQISQFVSVVRDALEVRLLIAKGIALGGGIISFMDNEGMRFIVQNLAFGGQAVPRGLSTRSIARQIFLLYEEKKKASKAELRTLLMGASGIKGEFKEEEINSYVLDNKDSVTAGDDPMLNLRRFAGMQDLWSARNKLGFLGVLLQAVDSSSTPWKIRTFPLACQLMRSPHTIDRVRDSIAEVLEEYGLSWEYVRSFTQDTTNSSIGVCKDIYHVGRVPCFSHTDQLFLYHSAEGSSLTTDVLDAVNTVSVSMSRPKRLQMLHDQQEQDKVPFKNVITAAATRWNSRCTQGERFLEILPQLNKVVTSRMEEIYPASHTSADDTKSSFVKAWTLLSEWGVMVLQPLLKFLRINAQWTTVLTSKNIATSPLVLPAIASIKHALADLKKATESMTASITEKHTRCMRADTTVLMKNNLTKEINDLTKAREALQEYVRSAEGQFVRYFGQHYTNSFFFLVPSLLSPATLRCTMQAQQIENAVLAGRGWFCYGDDLTLPGDDGAIEDEVDDDDDEDNIACGLNTFVAQQHQQAQQADVLNAAEKPRKCAFDSEVNDYIIEVSAMTSTVACAVDPLLYWAQQQKEKKYPVLTRIAACCLHIPATSGMAEQLFSTAGWILDPRRSSMSPPMLNALTTLYYMLRADMEKVGSLRDRREEKRRRTTDRLLKFQLIRAKNATIFVPGEVVPADLDDDDSDDEGPGAVPDRLRPLADALAAEKELHEEEENHLAEVRFLDHVAAGELDGAAAEAQRQDVELASLKAWLRNASVEDTQEKLDDFNEEKNAIATSEARKYELRTLMAAVSARLNELNAGKRVRRKRA